MNTEQLLIKLHDIGFNRFEHLHKEKRDNKQRFVWTQPIKNYDDWFTAILVIDNGKLFIEKLINPLGKDFERTDVSGLVEYIFSNVFKVVDQTDTN